MTADLASGPAFDVRRLVCFAAVAEMGTAAAAADHIGSSSSHVSAQIRALEQQLNHVKLFRRAARGLDLTDGGQAVMDQAHSLLQAELGLLAAAEGLRHSRNGELHLGAEAASARVPERTRLVERFLNENHVAFHLTEASSFETLMELERGAIDVALVCMPKARASYPGSYRVLTVRRSATQLLVPAWHRLACQSNAPQLPDLAGERLAAAPRSADPGFWDRCVAPLAAAGADLAVVPEWNPDALMDRVARHGELTILPDWLTPRPPSLRPEIVTWPFGQALCYDDLCLVARAAPDGVLSEQFLAAAATAMGLETDLCQRGAPFRVDAHGRRLYRHALDNGALRAFATVAETRSFTRAAAALYSSQPWLSTQVRSLEERLGLQLFARSPHHVELTDDGAVLLRHARAVLEEAERIGNGQASVAHRRPRPLRLGAPTYTLGLAGRRKLVQRYLESSRSASLEVQNGYGAQLLSGLRAGLLDAAVLLEPVDRNGLVTLALDELVVTDLVLPSDHPSARCAAASIAHLAGVRVATWRRELNPALYDRQMKPLTDAGVILVPMNGVLAEGVGEAAEALGLPWFQYASGGAVSEGYVQRPLQAPLRTQAVLAARDDRPWAPQLDLLWRVATDIAGERLALPAADRKEGQAVALAAGR